MIGVIGSDVHAVGNKLMELAFKEAGFNVVNVGVMASQEEFVEAAVESDAKVIVVSSLYGHGELDCQGLREKCDEAGLSDLLLYVGGNIVVGRQNWEEVRQRFRAMGFDRVYPPGSSPEDAIRDILADASARWPDLDLPDGRPGPSGRQMA